MIKFLLLLFFSLSLQAATVSQFGTCDNPITALFTPAFGGSVSAPTVGYSSQSGSCTKCGTFAYCEGRIILSSFTGGSGSGSVTITGLPWGSSTDSTLLGSCDIPFKQSWTTNGPVRGRIGSSGTVITQLSIDTATSVTDLTVANLSSSADTRFACTYITAQ